MKFEPKQYLIIAIVAILVSLPLAYALQHRTHQLKLEKTKNSTLQIQLNTKQKDLDTKAQQIQQEQQKNNDLQKQLQSKREQQETVAVEQAQPAPVAVSSASTGAGCEAYRGLVAQYNWNVNIALAVMKAESGCNPGGPPSPTCDRGLMQVNCVHSAAVGGNLDALYDPATNMRVAYAIYTGAGGWTPWTTYTSGAYLKYL